MKLEEFLRLASPDLCRRIVGESPALQRGRVWCHTCGHTLVVDGVACIQSGWPTHCGQTMSLDSPDERARVEGRTYQLVNAISAGLLYPGIQCLICRRISYHPTDIAQKYCGGCHRFHEDPQLPESTR